MFFIYIHLLITFLGEHSTVCHIPKPFQITQSLAPDEYLVTSPHSFKIFIITKEGEAQLNFNEKLPPLIN